MTINNMGVTNIHWGVCGFTSCFYAMYKMLPNSRPKLNAASQSHRVLAEIKTYLNILIADGEQQTLDDITAFTRSFADGFENFTIAGYINKVNDSVDLSEDQIIADQYFGIALPPHAVVDYLSRIWRIDTVLQDVNGADPGQENGILGVTSNNPNMPLYHGLEHYLYRHDNRIYSWGEQFDTVQAAGLKVNINNWNVCYFIATP